MLAVSAFLAACCCTLGFASCKNGDDSQSSGYVWTVEAVYARAQALGYDGTLEEFLASLKGEQGEKGETGAFAIPRRGD